MNYMLRLLIVCTVLGWVSYTLPILYLYSEALNTSAMLRLCFGNASVILHGWSDKGTTFSALLQEKGAIYIRKSIGKNS